MELAEEYDVVVVGSGIGGLAAASVLSRVGRKRVLVLERHFKLGGFTHSFRRGPFRWDPGVHYVGQMQEGAQLRQFFDLVTGGGVEWTPMPDGYDRFVYPDLDFTAPRGWRNYLDALVDRFPSERQGLERYFRDVRAAAGWYKRRMAGEAMPGAVARLLDLPGRRLALRTTGAYLADNFEDPRLRALLASQWGDYGLPPSRSPFALHSLIVEHYLGGAWYPAGGAQTISDAVVPIVKAGGGAMVVNAEVLEIIVERGAARGVRALIGAGAHRAERTVRAGLVISDAGAYNTFERLVAGDACVRERARLRETSPSMSAVQLFVGLDGDPRRLGVKGENTWIAGGYDHDEAYTSGGGALEGRPAGAFVVFPSLKDPRATAHTAEVITLVDHAAFTDWADSAWKHRGAGYEAAKERIAMGLLDLVDSRLPGFRAMVAFRELATPLTMEHFAAAPAGGLYGLAATPERLRARFPGVRTSVRGLLLAGADAASPGVAGAMMGGLMAAAVALGPGGFPRIAMAAGRLATPPRVPSVPAAEAAGRVRTA